MERCTSRELSDWQRRFSREPWPWKRDDDRIALMTANLMAAQGTRVGVEDCRVRYESPQEKESSEAEWDGWAERHNEALKQESSL